MPPLLLDVVRLTLWLVILAFILAPLERIFTLRKPEARPSIFADLGYFYLNGLLPTIIMAVPLAFLAGLVRSVTPSQWQSFVSGLPFWASISIGLVVAEIGTYWAHRWTHRSPTLWRFHAVHHTPVHVDWLINSRAHPVDIIFTRLAGLAPLYLLGLDGGGADRGIIPAIIVVLGTFWSFFVHANVKWRFGFLEQLIATPAFHHWHHTNDEHRDHNFAATLPIIDRVFGTLYLPDRFPAVYGIDEPIPNSLYDELVGPFKLGLSSASFSGQPHGGA